MKVFRVFVLLGLAFLLGNTVLAQKKGFNYDSAWQRVDMVFGRMGLPQSALKDVDKIYVEAKKENNEAQRLKALFYSLEFYRSDSEDEFRKKNRQIEKRNCCFQTTRHFDFILHTGCRISILPRKSTAINCMIAQKLQVPGRRIPNHGRLKNCTTKLIVCFLHRSRNQPCCKKWN